MCWLKGFLVREQAFAISSVLDFTGSVIGLFLFEIPCFSGGAEMTFFGKLGEAICSEDFIVLSLYKVSDGMG